MSASLMASFVTVAPAAVNSASAMPDFAPAPGSTAISAPSAFIFFTVSGVAATRLSIGSVSRATAMRIRSSPRADRRLSGWACAPGSERQCEQRNNDHDDAGRPGSGHEAMHRDQTRNEENAECDAPVAGNPADRQAQHNVDHMRAADKDEMNKTLIHCHMRGQVVAVRNRIVDLCMLGHLVLRSQSAMRISRIKGEGQRRL